MLCREVMKKDVTCIAENDTAWAAAKLMRDQNIGFLPVCSSDGKVIGTITDRDIVVRLAAEDGALTTTVDQVMTNELVCCKPQDDIARAETLMEQERKSRIVCVDDQGHAAGVISLSDIAQREDVARVGGLLRAIAGREALA
ncbi:MAG TPA: CBS domain-containing protein [Polyangiaceae bacterium]